MEYKRNILITGGAGFIGSHVVRLFVNKYPEYRIVNLDKLTYAGNLANLKDIEKAPNYEFVRADICDFETVCGIFRKYGIDGVIHLAAESHVDRSIKDPFTFARTNVMGTLSLLQAAKVYWESLPEKYEGKRFYHISTDEVYGALELTAPAGTRPAGGNARIFCRDIGDLLFAETEAQNRPKGARRFASGRNLPKTLARDDRGNRRLFHRRRARRHAATPAAQAAISSTAAAEIISGTPFSAAAVRAKKANKPDNPAQAISSTSRARADVRFSRR